MTGTEKVSGTGVAGVGMTAFLVAAGRSIEATRTDALARDTYARAFLETAPGCADWPTHLGQVPDGDADPLWGRLARFFGLRTRAFDDFLTEAAHNCRQVVVLGAGLDTRAHRLAWPDGTTVFEIDHEDVLRFKQSVLDARNAVPRAARVALPVDLRQDWTGPLIAAGFDPTRPTAWLAEGLLPYLPPTAERDLLRILDTHSAPGSVLGCEVKHGVDAVAQRDYPIYAAVRERTGIDLLALLSAEARPQTVAELAALGWTSDVYTPFDFTRQYGRGPQPAPDDALAANRWIFATCSAALRSVAA
ncbi:SAM-dependent methyltransferase [Streptomyces sp. NPDC005483]|uniref:SAM-dependent methyltransferase n=1 Tax=Streptomyces sp. NPDC005483 TaxID=3154882 RepID=UPI0033AEB875